MVLMSQSTQADESATETLLATSVHDVRYFASLLRGVNFINRATVTISEGGFTVTVEEARTLLATAYVFADIFEEYTYHAPPTSPSDSPPASPAPFGTQASTSSRTSNTMLEIPLNVLIDCINIFGAAGPGAGTGVKHKQWVRAGDDDREREDATRNNGRANDGNGRIEQYFSNGDNATGMRMSYAGEGHPLVLLIAEGSPGLTATCEITTYEAEPHLELPFDAEQTVLKIILKSSWLRDALSELDPSCEKLTFIGNPPTQTASSRASTSRTPGPVAKPMLRIQAAGTFGSTEMDYPNDREVLETFECLQTVNFSYRFGHISRTLRALQSSTKTSLRIDEEGLLSLQFLMPSPKPRGGTSDAFIEFRCLPLDETQ
ncbi:hypothetical protein EW146_g419 [Bondarzewia mesenterica]|uniref:Uncharacterized protein n=1 Tax=Bondarzewia mesenterica TaxID=1095465 RepID=A0A4S4M8J8_9AGAM|nr:hypothetical protein EW146_g419 [Bondarzewia mesenterica]